MGHDGLSRVIQGITTGIGFIGTGAILKQSQKLEIHGLTTAAGIWLTAAVGVAVGLGRIGIAIFSVILAWIVLSVLGYAEDRMGLAQPNEPERGKGW
jgi:putative Mg2+ transporter-C (MgtC) family protein